MPTIPQLFYTYTSTYGKDTESNSAIFGKETYTYSVVFDKSRHSIWSRNTEFGIPRINADNDIDTAHIRNNGIPVLTYNGATSFFYVNSYGAISIYETGKILSFYAYKGNEISTNSNILPQAVTGADFIDKFKWEINGTSVSSINLKVYVDDESNTPLLNENFTNDIRSYDVPNARINYQGIDEQVIYAKLTVHDNISTNEHSYDDSKTIVVVSFKSCWYYKVSVDAPELDTMTKMAIEPSVDGTIDSTSNTQYFWIYVPNNYTIVMEQGGGIADLINDGTITDSATNITYNKFRTPRTNVGGATYKLKFTKVNS